MAINDPTVRHQRLEESMREAVNNLDMIAARDYLTMLRALEAQYPHLAPKEEK